MRKMLHNYWFSGRACVGIILTENEVKERKAYIGAAAGFDQNEDAKFIADYGTKISIETLEEITKKLKGE